MFRTIKIAGVALLLVGFGYLINFEFGYRPPSYSGHFICLGLKKGVTLRDLRWELGSPIEKTADHALYSYHQMGTDDKALATLDPKSGEVISLKCGPNDSPNW